MVILFSGRKNKTENEIIEILTKSGASYISDRRILAGNEKIIIISEYKKTELKINKGIAVFIDDTDRFIGQKFPDGIIGICEDCNSKALEIFYENKIPVITCGMNAKNTIAISSISSNTLLASLQRRITDIGGNVIEPEEFKVKLSKKYLPYSVMASITILILCGIIPEEL